VVELRLLGPVEIVDGSGHLVAVSAPKRRAVLALLALDLNRVVSVERLVEWVWQESPPPRARAALQVHVSALRRLLEPGGMRVLTRAPGYALMAAAEVVDVHRFSRLLVRARAAGHEEAVQVLRQALGLWSGHALAGVPGTELVARAAAGLEESRLVAVEELGSRLLQLGRAEEAVAAITADASGWPPRESLVRLLMLALYQVGQQHRALDVYEDTRRRLRDDLGVDPTRPLQQAFEAILSGDPLPGDRLAARRPGEGASAGAAGSARAEEGPSAGAGVTRLAGRDDQVRRLAELLGQVADGRGGIAAVIGEPGIGKTALLECLLDQARARELRVCKGGAERLEAQIPFAAIRACLGLSLSSADPGLAGVARIMQGESPWGNGFASRHEAEVVATEALLAVVNDWCAGAPLVIVLDDLQWADPASAVVVHLLGRLTVRSPLLLVVAVRAVPLPGHVQELLDSLRGRGAVVLDLPPLDAAAVAELARDAIGALPGPSLREWVAGAAGNPLYTHEVLRGLTQAGQISITGGVADTGARRHAGLPLGRAMVSLSAVIDERLRMLSAVALEPLRVAALLGGTFTLLDLAVVLERPVPTLLPVVTEAAQVRVLQEYPDGTLGFQHDLIRQVLASQLPAAARTAMCHQAARALDAAGAPAERVAPHLAVSGIMDDWALSWLTRHADRLVSRTPAVAVDLLTQAMKDQPPNGQMHAALCSALLWSGRYREAIEAASQALSATDDPAQLAEIQDVLLRATFVTGAGYESKREAEIALAKPGLTEPHKMRIHSHLLLTLTVLEQCEEAERLGRELLAAARRDSNDPVIVYALQGLAMVAAQRGDFADAVASSSEAIGLMARTSLEYTVALGLYATKAYSLAGLDRMAEAAQTLDAAWPFADLGTASSILSWYVSVQAELAFRARRWDDALAETDSLDVLEHDLQTSFYWFAQDNHGLAALIKLHRGDSRASREHLAQATGDASGGVRLAEYWTVWAQALAAEAEGRPSEALELLHAFWTAGTGALAHKSLHFLCPDMLRLAALLDRRPLLAEVAAELRAQAPQAGAPSATAAATLAEGMAADNPDLLAIAVTQYEGTGRPMLLALAHEQQALALARAHRPAEAAAALDGALRIYQPVRATWDITRAEAALRQHGVRSTVEPTPPLPASGWDALSDTERVIATRIGQGQPDSMIATTLHLIGPSIESRITQILSKLGCESRAELAAIVTSRPEARDTFAGISPN
jgi:DNA-binding SARP family transcriptional activator/DNA-binding NarL/FixJ family response regulator